MKKLTVGLFVLMTASLAIAACGGGKPANESSKPAPKPTELMRLPVPSDFAAKQPTVALADAAVIEKGKALYEDATKGNCLMCHGLGGKGDGASAAAYTDPKVADLTAASFQDAVTDQYIFWRLTNVAGSKAYPASAMLGFPAGSDDDRWALVAYVRSLKGK